MTLGFFPKLLAWKEKEPSDFLSYQIHKQYMYRINYNYTIMIYISFGYPNPNPNTTMFFL